MATVPGASSLLAHMRARAEGIRAQLIDLFTLQSTDGPVRHAKVRCSGGHSYTGVIN